MANLEFSRQEIVNLTRRVSNVDPPLSERETTLLLAIFAAAADRATPVGLGGGATLPGFEIRNPPAAARTEREMTLSDLQQQLLNAYIPGSNPDPVIPYKVVGVPVGWPPPPPPPPPENGD